MGTKTGNHPAMSASLERLKMRIVPALFSSVIVCGYRSRYTPSGRHLTNHAYLI